VDNLARKSSKAAENKKHSQSASNKKNVLDIGPLFPYENTRITEEHAFCREVLRRRSTIINQIDNPDSPLKTNVEFVISLYRLRFNYLSSKQNYAGIHETVEDYNSWMKYIIQARGAKSGESFDIFSVSEKDIAEMKRVLEKIPLPSKTKPVQIPQKQNGLSSVEGSQQKTFVIPNIVTSISVLPRKVVQLQQIFRTGFVTKRHLRIGAIYLDDYSIEYLELEDKTNRNIKKSFGQ
jgi:hypothetical protein